MKNRKMTTKELEELARLLCLYGQQGPEEKRQAAEMVKNVSKKIGDRMPWNRGFTY